MKVTMPRFLLAEFNTHRVFSRNAGSSRAIPVERRIKQVQTNPFIPISFGGNVRGMQAGQTITEVQKAEEVWLEARDVAVKYAQQLANLGLHKQHANRILEPFSWVDVIVSSTQWDNFWHLRDSEMAQPEFEHIAKLLRKVYNKSRPFQCKHGEWHIPGITIEDQQALDTPDLLMLSAGRLARVSYESEPKSREEDIKLAQRLVQDGHFSPMEHQAKCSWGRTNHCRNFVYDWEQWRAFVEEKVIERVT